MNRDDDDRRRHSGKHGDPEPDGRGQVIQFRPAPGKTTRAEMEGAGRPHGDVQLSRAEGPPASAGAWDADQDLLDAMGLFADDPVTIDRPAEESLQETRATIDDSAPSWAEGEPPAARDAARAAATIDRPAEESLVENRATIDDSGAARADQSGVAAPREDASRPARPKNGTAATTIDRPAEESLVDTRATIDDAPGAAHDGAAEPGWVIRARAYHRQHPDRVRAFNRLTGGACGDGDTVDPLRVARWQQDHGVPLDGRVGSATLRAARADAAAGKSVQRKAAAGGAAGTDVQSTATAGVRGSGGALPHLDAIQTSFGRHDVSHVRAHVGGDAADAATAIGAEAYATGNDVAFAAPPTLHTAAHEAAHVVQQRGGVHLKGGVGEAGDSYEQHADTVADAVVAGRSAEPLLDGFAGAGASMSAVQMQVVPSTASVERSLAEAERIIRDEVRGTWLPALYNAIGVRDYHGARDAGAALRVYMSNAERRLADAREEQGVQLDDTLRQRIDDVAMIVRTAGVEVDAAVRLVPAVEDSSTEETSTEPVLESSVDEAEAWSSWMDAEENLADVVGEQEANKRPIADDRSEAVGPVHPDAVSGIHLVIQAPPLPKYDQILDRHLVGPGEAGPYRFQPHVRERRLLYYVAFHRERKQQEWVIGPDSIDAFVQDIEVFVIAARNAYPGSNHLPDSQKDGADQPPHLPSILELESFGQAPWQQQFGGGALTPGAQPSGGIDAADGSFDPMGWLAQGANHTNGGPALVGMRNTLIRLQDYRMEAERLAGQLFREMNAGRDHLEVRADAVEGRNHLLRGARENMSPAASYMSSKIKSERAVDVGTMTRRKTGDVIDKAAGNAKDAMEVLGAQGDAATLRARLAQDSDMWAEYIARLQTGHDARLLFEDATQQLGEREPVSRAIVESAGSPNKVVTGLAILGTVANAGAAIYGLYNFIKRVDGAEEGQKLHVAGRELAGFAGGVIGAEAGAATAVWIATAIASPSVPALIVVSIIGGAVGGAVGAQLGPSIIDVWGGQLNAAGMAVLGPGAAQNGGYNGLHERSMREGLKAKDIEAQLADAIFARDLELNEIEEQIENARDEKELKRLWAHRLAVIDDRNALGNIYGALKMEFIDESDAWSIVGGGAEEREP